MIALILLISKIKIPLPKFGFLAYGVYPFHPFCFHKVRHCGTLEKLTILQVSFLPSLYQVSYFINYIGINTTASQHVLARTFLTNKFARLPEYIYIIH